MKKHTLLLAVVSVVLSACSGSTGTPIGAPTAVSRNAAKLSWAAVQGATSYVVYAGCGSDTHPCTDLDKISDVAVTGTTFDLDVNNPKHLTDVYHVAACTISGCGPLSTTSTVVPIPSIAMSAAAASEVTEGQSVSLLGRASPSKGKTVASWQWSQFGNDGDPNLGHDPITIVNADKQNASFVAPAVAQPTRYAFMLLAIDSAGAAGSEIVVVSVKPATAPIVTIPTKTREAIAGQTVILNAVGSDASGTYSWAQVSTDPLKPAIPGNLQVSLQNANTANPSFVAPAVTGTGTGTLAFEVTHTAANGKKSKTQVTVGVTPQPTQTASQAATAGTLTQPLTVPSSSGKKSVPPQKAITLYGNPDATVIAGKATQVSINAAGGSGALSYSWKQVGGTSATLSNSSGAILGVTAPAVTAAEVLSFELTVTDAVGMKATGIALVTVWPTTAVTTLPAVQGTAVITLPLSQMIAGQTIPIKGFASDVTSVVLTQRGGRPGTVTQISDKEWSFTAPAAGAAQSEPLGLTITMNYASGSTKILRLPIQLLSPTGVTTLPANAGWVVPPPAEALALAVGSPRVDEGTKNASISANASGGTRNYTYSWTYVPGAGSPYTAVSLNLRPNGNHLVFDAPVLTKGGINLNFLVKVDDGKSFVSKNMLVNINDLGDVVASNGSDLRVPSGQQASLSFPVPSGGVPPYSYAVTQVSGTTVALTGANSLSPTFTAPTLAQGAANTQLAFEMTITDAVGNTVKARELVAVEAPQRFKVTLDPVNGPVTPGTPFNLHANAGGTLVKPVTYQWVFKEGSTDVTSQLTVTGGTTDNPSVTIPDALAGKTLRVGLSATDSTTPTAQKGVASPAIVVQVGAAVAVTPPALSVSVIAPTGPVPTEETQTLSYSVFSATNAQWIVYDHAFAVDGAPASFASSGSDEYLIPAEHVGKRITVTVTVEDELGNTATGSAEFDTVAGTAAVIPPVIDVDQTKGQALTCQVCDGRLCLVAESTEPVGSGPGICMTTIIDDANFRRTIRKYVAPSVAAATSLWWDQTSDNNYGCMSIFYNQDSPNGQFAECHYACVTTNCNSDIWPAEKTLYRPPGM